MPITRGLNEYEGILVRIDLRAFMGTDTTVCNRGASVGERLC